MNENYEVIPHLRAGALMSILLGLTIGMAPSVREWVTKEYHAGHAEKAVYALLGGVAALGVSSYVQHPIDRLQRRRQATEDVSDNVLVQSQWEQQILPGVKTEPDEPKFPIILWNDFVQDVLWKPEVYPHIGVFGPTGTGKTSTIELFGDIRYEWFEQNRLETPRRIYLSPTVMKDEFLGWETIGTGFDAPSITELGTYLKEQLLQVYSVQEGKAPSIICPDEFRWINKYAKDVVQPITDVLDMGRKGDINIFLSAVSYLVKSLGLEGEGQIRDNMLPVLKGRLAIDKAAQLEREGMVPNGFYKFMSDRIAQFGVRACLVQDSFMLLPDTSKYRQSKVNSGYTHIVPVPKSIKSSKWAQLL